ncbi:MAG: TROVE domain-containing protein [Tannerella sp.]|jgi:hypothetical protein|nr:TROVE domain-containing protein [Tannerella sp.]
MKFNESSKAQNKTFNSEGAPAYRLSPEWHLYTAAVTSLLSDKFYEGAQDRIHVLRELIGRCDPQFVAKLAVYAREQMYLRSVPLVLAVELAKVHNGDATVRRTVARVVQRADEITELLAYYQQANGRKGTKKLNRLSKQLQAGLQDAFNRFDEYQFAKYDRATAIRLRDALFLVHPGAKDEAQQALFDKIAARKLETPYTWETELSALGQTKFESPEARATAFRHKWEALIDSGKIGYMALMRNLRNLLETGISTKHVKQVCDALSAPDAVRKSRQFPFRFLAAYRELSGVRSGHTSRIMSALEQAVLVSAQNIAGFDEDTRVLVACDVSGSMQKAISAKSAVKNYDIGLMLGMLLKSRCKNALAGMFGDTWKIVNLPGAGVLSSVDAFYRREGEVGYSTNGYLVVQDLIDHRIAMDKIMIFTDCQLWDNTGCDNEMVAVWTKYKQMFPDARLYLFDLAGYGNTPLSIDSGDVYLIAGWSDKIFDMLAALERGSDALTEIGKTEL